MDKKQEAIERGHKAKAILDNELFKKWWESAEKSLFLQMKEASATDYKRLNQLKALMDAHKSMRRDFERYVREGKESQLGRKKIFN